MATWEDRIQPAAYVGPDGTRIPFDFVDLRGVLRKKTTPHDSPTADGTFVEDQGLKGDQFPLRVIFHGDDHDLEARRFLDVLAQRGPGRLEHPLYGVHTVIPFGDITRNDAVVTAANQTIFDVTFWATIAALYPSADADTLQLVDDAVNSYDEIGAQQFDDSLFVSEPGARAKFKQDMTALKDGVKSVLKAAQDGSAKLTSKMDRIDKALQSTIDTFVGGPLTIASQMRQLMGAPARSLQLARQRLDAYKGVMTSITEGRGVENGGGTGSSDAGTGVVDPGTSAPGAQADANNTFHANRMVAETAVLAVAQAVSGEQYTTRREALTAALELATIFDQMTEWSEANYTVLFESSAGPDATRPHVSGVGAIDTGEARQVVLLAVTRTLAYLITTSFTLGVERSLVVTSPRTAIDLCAELYGADFVDKLDDFMNANEFNGDEILEIPPGTTVRYHVD